MEIVIEIPENVYQFVMNTSFVEDERSIFTQSKEDRKKTMILFDILDAIRNGTPLPKGHGKLKDVDAFLQKVKKDREHAAYTRSWDADDVLSALDKTYAPTIIEADRGGEDEIGD